MRTAIRLALCFLGAVALQPAGADEGMWTFDNFPSALVKERYGVDITPAWLERVRLGTVRLSNCTASFVSPEGLILTNHHCVASCLAEHSSREQSLLETGFMASERPEELRCSTQIADVLMAMQDITAEVLAATSGMNDTAANDQRKKTLTALEQTCEEASQQNGAPLKCESVTLYDGGQYYLYKYKRYDDVRLVFAPEDAIAAFGGDPDNFQFPRWCLDMGILRAYAEGKPAATPQHLSIDFDGPAAGEPVFVSGHPGSTDRLLTVAQLETIRNVDLPPALLRSSELRGRYIEFAKTSEGAENIVRDPLNGLENGIKVRRKLLDALLDDTLLDSKRADEANLRARVANDPQLRRALGDTGDPWARIEAAQAIERGISLPYTFLENAVGFNSRLFRYARILVRAAEERPKANTDRLPEYADASLPRIEQQIQAPLPVYPELEQLTLSYSFERMREWLGPDHPIVRRLLATESPDTLASRLISGSTLADPAVRMALWRGGQTAIDASADPMIALARSIDEDARSIRKRYEDEVEAVVDVASQNIAKARFAAFGTEIYPDATFTLRINFGSVAGWNENGTPIPPFTHLSRLFERATGQTPFAVPQSWIDHKAELDLSTPFNVSTNNDIVGGNSGSPLVNAKGNIVGLMFDGNIHSISGDYWFDTAKNRAIGVDTAIIREALVKVYRATGLMAELSSAD